MDWKYVIETLKIEKYRQIEHKRYMDRVYEQAQVPNMSSRIAARIQALEVAIKQLEAER